MEKEKNILLEMTNKANYNLKENIKMEKEKEKEKNMMKNLILYLKENINLEKDMVWGKPMIMVN